MPADEVKAKHFTVVFYIYMQSELEHNILLMNMYTKDNKSMGCLLTKLF